MCILEVTDFEAVAVGILEVADSPGLLSSNFPQAFEPGCKTVSGNSLGFLLTASIQSVSTTSGQRSRGRASIRRGCSAHKTKVYICANLIS